MSKKVSYPLKLHARYEQLMVDYATWYWVRGDTEKASAWFAKASALRHPGRDDDPPPNVTILPY